MPAFTSPPKKLDFHLRVWEVVRQIPRGKVSTYGRIAAMLPPPEGTSLKSYLSFGARWVGEAMAKSPDNLPWWRVVNAQGKISIRTNAAGQRAMLEAEGVIFDAHGKIDLTNYLWSQR